MTGTLLSIDELRAKVTTQLLDIGFTVGGLSYDELASLQASLRRHAQKPTAKARLAREIAYGQTRVKISRQLLDSPLVIKIAERQTNPHRLTVEDLNLILDRTPQTSWKYLPSICGVDFPLESTSLQLGIQLGVTTEQARLVGVKFTSAIDDLVHYRAGRLDFYTLDPRVRHLLAQNSRVTNMASLRRRMAASTKGDLRIRGFGSVSIRILKRWLIDNGHADLADRLRD